VSQIRVPNWRQGPGMTRNPVASVVGTQGHEGTGLALATHRTKAPAMGKAQLDSMDMHWLLLCLFSAATGHRALQWPWEAVWELLFSQSARADGNSATLTSAADLQSVLVIVVRWISDRWPHRQGGKAQGWHGGFPVATPSVGKCFWAGDTRTALDSNAMPQICEPGQVTQPQSLSFPISEMGETTVRATQEETWAEPSPW
jgi:hypothetical protein